MPRALKTFDTVRVQKLMQLADLLLSSQPTESTERTVKYLIKLSLAQPQPDPVPPLGRIAAPREDDFTALQNLDPANMPVLFKLVPQMRFVARLGRAP